MERPSVIMENGHVTHLTFAVSDVDKNNQIPAGSNHGSKVIVVPFDGVSFEALGAAAALGRAGLRAQGEHRQAAERKLPAAVRQRAATTRPAATTVPAAPSPTPVDSLRRAAREPQAARRVSRTRAAQ